MTALLALIHREILLARRSGGALTGVIFFLILTALIPFAIGPDKALLARIGPAILWIGALLATLLVLDRLFQADEDDGSLDILMMSGLPLELIVMVKCGVHWGYSVLPLVVATPLFGTMLGVEMEALLAICLTMLVGTPALVFIGAIGAALTVSLRRGGLLLAVIILPLTIPLLIFAVASAQAVMIGPMPFKTPFTVLCGLSLLIIALSPLAAAAALRQAHE